MKFLVTDAHVNRQNRKSVWTSIFLLLVATALFAVLFRVQKWTDLLIPVIAIYAIGTALLAMYKKNRQGATSYPVVNLDESAGTLSVSYNDVSVSLALNQLTNLRLQYKSGNLQSVLIETTAMGLVRFEGYAQLEVLAETLQKYVPLENIKTVSFFLR